MANEQNNNQDQGQMKNIEANTMASDNQSIKDQGGNEPKPYTPQEDKRPESSNPNDVFTPPSVPDVSNQNQPPQQIPSDNNNGGDNTGGDNPLPPKRPGNKTFLIILISIIVIGAVIAGYILLSSGNGEVTVEIPEENIEESEEIAEEEAIEEEPITEEEEVIEETHTSMFSIPADSSEGVVLNPVDLISIRQVIDYGTSEEETLREIVMRDENGQLVGFSAIAQAIAPTVFSEEIASAFNNDATFYSFSNSNGSWFGIIASLSTDANVEETRTSISSIENSINEIKNFYVSDPGAEGSWADGSAEGITTRYITFGNSGAAFNYGWDGNTLIMGTSYPSFSEAASRL